MAKDILTDFKISEDGTKIYLPVYVVPEPFNMDKAEAFGVFKELQDELESKDKTISELQEENRWRDVTKELPDTTKESFVPVWILLGYEDGSREEFHGKFYMNIFALECYYCFEKYFHKSFDWKDESGDKYKCKLVGWRPRTPPIETNDTTKLERK